MASVVSKDPTTVNGENVDGSRIENGASQSGHGDDMSPWECIKRNPKIAMWTVFTNVGSCLIGYENLILSVCLAMPAFQQTFAIEVSPGVFTIPAYWQAAWNATFNVMSIFGSVFAGWVQDRFGRRIVFIPGIVSAAAGIALAYTANSAPHFLGGKICTGFALGAVVTATQTYVSEITPLPMRGIALSVYTIMMNIGMLIAISSTFSRVNIMDKSAFRVLFAAGWTFPGVLALGLPFLPESPYWLVMKNRPDDARKALQRLSGPQEDLDVRIRGIEAVVEAERRLAAEAGTFLDCFRGVNARRTGIILICMYMPQVVGSVLSSNAPYFLYQTGLTSDTVVMLVQIGISMGVVSALLNVYFMMKFGRRTLMFFGVGLCCLMYLIMGIGGVVPRSNSSLLAIGVALQFTSISYGPAVGASVAVAGEVSAARLRGKSVGIGTGFMYVTSTIWTVVMPYLFNQDEANLGGNIGWIFFGMGLIMLVVMFFYIPETKDRSFDELDILFEKKVPTREFKKHLLD